MAIPAVNLPLAPTWNRTAAPSPAAVMRDVTKNKKAARDFEALLLTPVLDSLQTTFSGDREDSIAGASDFRHMGTQALASAIAERGGIGIARLILSHLQVPKERARAEPGSVPKG